MIITPTLPSGLPYFTSYEDVLTAANFAWPGGGAYWLKSNLSGSQVFVLNSRLDVRVVDTATNTIVQSVNANPPNTTKSFLNLQVNQDSTKVLATSYGGAYVGGNLHVFNLSNGTTDVISPAVGTYSFGSTFNADRSKLYTYQVQGPATWAGGGAYNIFNGLTGAHIGAYTGGNISGSDYGICFNQDYTKLYLSDTNTFSVINAASNIKIGSVGNMAGATSSIYAARRRPVGNQIWFNSYGSNSATWGDNTGNGFGTINTLTDTLTWFGQFPGGAPSTTEWNFSADGAYIYMPRTSNVDVISVETRTIIDQIPVYAGSQPVCVLPSGDKAYIINGMNGSLAQLT